MPINVPEFPTNFGAIDSTAFSEDGGPFNSHALRAMAKNANRLITKGQMLFTLAWPATSHDTDIDTDIGSTFEGYATPHWNLCHPPISIPKKPGLNSGTFKLYVTVQATARILFQIVTRKTGSTRLSHARIGDSNVAEVIGDSTSSPQLASFSGVPLDPGPSEVVELYARLSGGGALADTSAYGSPNTGTHGSGGVEIGRDYILASSGAWDQSSPNLVTSNHFIYFYEGSGGSAILATTPKKVWSIVSGTKLEFAPPLYQRELSLIENSSGSFEIRAAGGTNAFSVFGFSGFADARSI
jgi:hypothetical protein